MHDDKDLTSTGSENDFAASLLNQVPDYQFLQTHTGLDYNFMIPGGATPVAEAPIPQSASAAVETGDAWLNYPCSTNEDGANRQQGSQEQAVQPVFERHIPDSFDLNKILTEIFWRIDVNRNNRISKAELEQAVVLRWFSGDSAELAKILFDDYDRIVPLPYLEDAGLSIEDILRYPPFSHIAQIKKPPAPKPSRMSFKNLFFS
jgi:hypothetical protein